MNRRQFISNSAAAGITANVAANMAVNMNNASASSHAAQATIMGEPAPILKERLVGRNQNRSTVVGRNGICATSQAITGTVGVDILKNGGNAVDAAVAMSAMMSVVEPMSCGPGGDLFAIVWIEKDQKLYGLNASGRSPYAWNLDAAKEKGYTNQLPELGPHTWSVPGCVSGWDAIQKKLGKQDFATVLAPAMEYARKGFVVSEIIGGYFNNADRAFRDYPNAMQTYTMNGKPPEYGQVFRNPDMANFFEILMKNGADAYYQGEIAERIVKYSEERGGMFSLKDFADHTATWVDPASTNYRGYDVWEIPPNGQGIAALQMLNLLEHFDIASMKPNSAEHLHLFIEAKKLAFEDRAVYYADMEHADVPLKQLISKDYAKERVKRINPKQAATDVKAGVMDGSSDTIYLCTSDAEGNMVSLIQSIYSGWGSREVPIGLGFCLQNRGRAFMLNPNHRNKLEPHKRPFHTIIPGFVTKDGKPKCAFGVMGGDMQPQGHVQVLMNLIDFHMSIQQTAEQPRVEHYGSSTPWGGVMEGSGTIGIEAGIDEATISQLKEMGHVVKEVGEGMYGGYQAVWREENPMRYFGGSETRKDGAAVGY